MKNDLLDDDDDLDIEILPYYYVEQMMVRKVHHYYISDAIDEPPGYVKMIHQITSAGQEETIIIHLNTEGGDLSTGIQLVNAMKYTQAHVICSLEGLAYSLGSLIFLAADEFIVHDNSVMMIHHFTGGIFGKGNEQVAQLEATMKWFTKLAQTYYTPFITDDELANILKGEDMWLQTDDIRKRLIKMVKKLKKENSTK